jgi:hypothetical protein
MSTLQGYSLPLTPGGKSSLVARPPWNYAGPIMTIDYHADPAAVAAFLPQGLKPDPDAGSCSALFCEFQSCSNDRSELLDPVRSQYREFLILINALLDSEPVTYCPFIWVDGDFALVRGWIQGYPKKMGSVWMTRTYGLNAPADPGLAPGSVYGAAAASNGWRLAQATLTLERSLNRKSGRALINSRHLPQLEAAHPRKHIIHDLVRSLDEEVVVQNIWEGASTLDFFEAASEELIALAPVRVGKGYLYYSSWTVSDLKHERAVSMGANDR